MRMLLIDLLMRSILLLHMIGGKVRCTVYFQLWHILVPGLGSIGGEESKLAAFRNMSSPNMTILVYAPADPVLCIKG
jgi:hypothetical protein